jgi:hypothetical protein
MEGSYTQAILREIRRQGMWIDTHLLEMKEKVATGIKDDPVPSHNQSVPRLNLGPRLPTKVPFKGGSPPSTPNPSFFLASPNLGDEIPFKGGSM